MAIVLLLGGWGVGGCGSGDKVPSATRTPPPGIRLETDAGPVTLLSMREDRAGGIRELLLRSEPEGDEALLRLLRIRTAQDPARPGFFTTRYTLLAPGDEELLSLSRTVREGSDSFLEAELQGGGDRLFLRSRPEAGGLGVYAFATRRGETRSERRTLDPARLGDPSYQAGVAADLEALYPSGPLVDGRERRLLDAVLGSPTWEEVMGEAPGGVLDPLGTGDDSVARNIRRMCAVSALASKLSCMAVSVFPYAWIVCVPSTGIQLACMAIEIFQVLQNNLDDFDWPCSSCEDPRPPPDPGS